MARDTLDDPYYHDDDDDGHEGEDDFEEECGLMNDGQCTMAGSEHCDFVCPNRDGELFVGSRAWHKKHSRGKHR